MNFLEHGELTRIFPLSYTEILCWYCHAACGESSPDRHVYIRDSCNNIQSVFLYDKVTGILKHACSGVIACLRQGDSSLIVSQSNCNADPVWMQANNRFTRTSCKCYKQMLLSAILLLVTYRARIQKIIHQSSLRFKLAGTT